MRSDAYRARVPAYYPGHRLGVEAGQNGRELLADHWGESIGISRGHPQRDKNVRPDCPRLTDSVTCQIPSEVI